jgi:hypothetical protein
VALVGLAACAHAPPDLAAPELATAWTSPQCVQASADADGDGLDDACELALAAAFAPELVVDARDCLWREVVEPAGLAGGYFFAAQPTLGEGTIRIAYLPAYYRDCGWTGMACTFRGADCSAHAGDSELIVLDVAPDLATGSWRTVGVFLSAHCFGRSDGRCRWFRGAELRAFAWVDDVAGGAPRVWVARGKHANYPSRAACDSGHWYSDTCDQNRVAVRFPVRSTEQNLGSRLRPRAAGLGCVAAEGLPLAGEGAHAGARECFWDSAAPFWGWQAERTGTPPTPYAHYLTVIAGF